MRLESVRALKQEIVTEAVNQVLLTREALPAGARASRSALPAAVPPPPIALGVERQGSEYRLAVRIQTVNPGLQANLDEITARAHGEVSVRVVGRVVKQQLWHQSRIRPLLIGSSVGHPDITAGTLGCFVQSDELPGTLILSNNHVLANENQAVEGDEVLQPGAFDGGTSPVDAVATLSRFEPLRKTGNNLIDAAVATLDESIGFDARTLTGLGQLNGVRIDPLLGDEVVLKVGRTTGVTRGRVSAFEVDDIWVGFDMGVIGFDRQIEIAPIEEGPFSLGGDSGSLIVDEDRRAVGLLFAGNDVDVTYANPIEKVLSTLAVRI